MALNVALLGALIGFFVKVLGDKDIKLRNNLKSYGSTLVLGLLAAVATGYFAGYATNAIFGANVTDWVTLFGVGFAAVITGVTAAQALGNTSSLKK